ncbi:MAG: T9SS type A sorting domain-containing protein [Ignavibacteriales bacterium]|nr:T9SS type A sorting domain-containing protein [Ignavibacteriales bacterium]
MYSTSKGENFTVAYGIEAGYDVDKIHVYNNKFGFVLGSGHLYYTNDISYYTTDINDKEIVPTRYSLEQNYPNPFNPSTKISYQIPRAGFVTLKIYDLIGREVETLVSEFQQAGKYNSQFSILNSQLSSGVYFYTLKVGNFVKTKKLILMK